VTYTVWLEPSVELQIETIASWWREHRPENPDLFEEELTRTLLSLASFPERGIAIPRSRPRSSRRYLVIQRTSYLVRYSIDPATHRVIVNGIRYGRRNR
jgi:plasmid stabilization system protein ParE